MINFTAIQPSYKDIKKVKMALNHPLEQGDQLKGTELKTGFNILKFWELSKCCL